MDTIKRNCSTPALTAPGAILLLSCYELGMQPLGLAAPAAILRRAGYHPATVDVAVETLPDAAIRRARLVGISVPMHTATRIGVRLARRVRCVNAKAHIAFYGMYAALNERHLLDAADTCHPTADGEELLALARELDGVEPPVVKAESRPEVRVRFPVPDREGLPPLDRYARFVDKEDIRIAASVATTTGCKHACRHCPIPAVERGRFRALPVDDVMRDIENLVAAGARHISFSDPDFLNGPTHASRVVTAMQARFPRLTFDFTAKVEHLLAHADRLPQFRDVGCRFVVSAVESLSDRTLGVLRKGHTRRDTEALIRTFAAARMVIRPTFVPFNPWDTLDLYIALLDWIERESLVDCVDPVQLSVRLLVPPGSLLLGHPEMRPHITSLDATSLTWSWRHPDPRMDALHARVASIVCDAAASDEDDAGVFQRIVTAARRAAALDAAPMSPEELERRYPRNRAKPPRLTEDWFC